MHFSLRHSVWFRILRPLGSFGHMTPRRRCLGATQERERPCNMVCLTISLILVLNERRMLMRKILISRPFQ